MRLRPSLPSVAALAALSAGLLRHVHALNITAIPSPNLDLSQLGRVAVVGDFESISVYQYQGQSQNTSTAGGGHALLGRYPDGTFGTVAVSDGAIEALCPFISKEGVLAGIVVGGNFTSLGGVQAQGIALFDPVSNQVTPLPGLSGRVTSLLCDHDTATTYVGGAFTGGNSSNAIFWVTGWTNLPFAGFNGPVTSIVKAPNGNIIFGGEFTGLGNNTSKPEKADAVAINIGSADVSATSTSSTQGFNDPRNIVCKDFTRQGSGSTWLVSDNSPGSWSAKFSFGFNPTVLRLWNTNYQGRGTKTFRMTALPINGIMNLTYTDSTGRQQYCDARCPLPEGNTAAQDFRLVNPIGMNEVRIDISDHYGAGAGLNGIELLQDDMFTYAVSSFNEPSCSGTATVSNSTSTGPWQRTPSGQSDSDYLTATFSSGPVNASAAAIIFTPNVQESGNYTITVYTPGCIQDGSCSSRGVANITGQINAQGGRISATVAQTNSYDKYDRIYTGPIDATTTGFKPTFTLTAAADQPIPLTLVAQRIRFELINSTGGGLNGLFEYNPNQAMVNTTDFSTSAINRAGRSFTTGATVSALAVADNTLYVAGNFTPATGRNSTGVNNILRVGTTNATALPNGGLNNAVDTMYQTGSTLYIGGNFTRTGDESVSGLNGVAAFSTSDNRWSALGAGVDGTVSAIVPLQMNITAGDLQDVVAVSGRFQSVNAFGSNAAFSVDNIALWVPSRNNWLNNLANAAYTLSGNLNAQTTIPNMQPLFAGNVAARASGVRNAAALSGNGLPTLAPLGLTINSNYTASASTSSQQYRGAVTGVFLQANNLNITAIGGSFSTSTSNGTLNNLAVVNHGNNGQVTGLPATIYQNSTILSMDTRESTLFIGGRIAGTSGSNTVDGFLVYDLNNGALASTQPPALNGPSVVVNTVVVQPSSTKVFVGGNFTQAGSLNCEALCVYDTSSSQWTNAGSGLSGAVTTMAWASPTRLVLAGNLTAGGNKSAIVNYDATARTYSTFPGAGGLPGPITALTPASSDYNQFWAAGTASNNNSAYLQKYDGNAWIPVGGLGSSSEIRSLQVMTTTADHGDASLVNRNEVLLLTGNIAVPGFGTASAVIFNGTTYQPFLLTSSSGSRQGSVERVFVQNPGNFLTATERGLAIGFVVLIALAIALALIFLIVVIGIILERHRRRQQGYMPIKQLSADQQANLNRMPPERLFGTLGEKSAAPKI